MRKKRKFAFVAVFVVGAIAPAASADITFFVAPNAHPSTSSTLDVPWQTAVGNSFVEFDFEGFANESSLDTLSTGGLLIDVGLGGAGGSSGTARIFQSSSFGTPGTVFQKALLNGDASRVPHSEITFEFSSPVQGAGMWVFDDVSTSYELIATDADGTVTSSVLESGNGRFKGVEGWLGATSDTGITSLAIRHVAAGARFFEIDHFQVAPQPIPAPGAAFLGLVGLPLVARVRRRWN